MSNDNEAFGDEEYIESTPLDDELISLQQQISELQWRLNALSTFLSLRYPDDRAWIKLAGCE
jgi:hypothetical protein